jgi:transcriptional regulator with XRE-family HTH domain
MLPKHAKLVSMGQHSFASVLNGLQQQRKLTQLKLATFLGVKRITLYRWQYGRRVPTVAKARPVIARVFAAEPKWAAMLADSLDTTLPALGLAAESKSPADIRDAIDAALCAVAEHADTSPRALRPALAVFLRRLAALSVSPADAAAALSAPRQEEPTAVQ